LQRTPPPASFDDVLALGLTCKGCCGSRGSLEILVDATKAFCGKSAEESLPPVESFETRSIGGCFFLRDDFCVEAPGGDRVCFPQARCSLQLNMDVLTARTEFRSFVTPCPITPFPKPPVPVVAKFIEVIKWGIACIDGPCVPLDCKPQARLDIAPPFDLPGGYCADDGHKAVTLDASGSTPAAGSSLAYRWTIEPIGPPGPGSTRTGPLVTVELPVGRHRITLVVFDPRNEALCSASLVREIVVESCKPRLTCPDPTDVSRDINLSPLPLVAPGPGGALAPVPPLPPGQRACAEETDTCGCNDCPKCDDCGLTGDPVHLPSGAKVLQKRDVQWPAPGGPIVFMRTYMSDSTRAGGFGPAWSHTYERFIEENPGGAREVDGRGVSLFFAINPAGGYHPARHGHATL